MQNIIALEVLTAVSKNGFSLDELVISARKLFEQEGMSGLIGLLVTRKSIIKRRIRAITANSESPWEWMEWINRVLYCL
ncbi:MAG: hypothetical protein AMJ79_14900 [Phycisphaerae bacterium SM23_30]|nr:MAG: hypothetical protein AMJ79_14900 [Phycisphaerae bacterium SM23_30]